MHGRLAAGVAACCILTSVTPTAQSQISATTPVEQPAAGDIELDAVHVIGEQPGPGMWKVSKGDHVLWVFASYRSLPKGVTWRTQEVETRIGESLEVLYPGYTSIQPDIGVFHALTLIPAALKTGKNPGGAKLKDVLPPDIYVKWRELREKYMGRDDKVEKWRPAIALGQLRAAAYPGGGPPVDSAVANAAKKYGVPIRRLPTLQRVVRVKGPRGMLKSARKTQLPDLECFIRGLDNLESDVERTRQLGAAWARGDIGKLRELHRVHKLTDDCVYVLMTSISEGKAADVAHAKELAEDMRWHGEQTSVQVQRDWVAAVQAALDKNRSTFAVLPLSDVLRPDGHLEKLRALGYTVEEPL